jgi:hypothetical protein
MFRRTLLVFALTAGTRPVMAGMPSFSLTEVAEARLDTISFFLFAFALSALVLRGAWNVLARDFAWMPRLRYPSALAVLVVSGLFVYVALSLIAGARELMTPGAWVRTGSTHRLATPERDPKPWLEAARRTALENLRDNLWEFAAVNEGALPPHRLDEAIPQSNWSGVHPLGEPYGYIPGGRPGEGSRVIVFEPDAYGPFRFALQENGTVVKLTAAELSARLHQEVPPAINQ